MSAVIKTCLIDFFLGMKDAIVGLFLVPCIHRKIEQQRTENYRRLQDSLAARERSSNRRRVNPLSYEKYQQKSLPTLNRRLFLAVSFGAFMWLSVIIFSIKLMPNLKYGFERFYHTLLSQPNSTSLGQMWYYAEASSYFFFNTFLILPLTLINKLAVGFWLLDIADMVYRVYYGSPKSFPSVSAGVADILYSIPLAFLFLIQGNAANYLLIQGLGLPQVLYCFHISLLYALYAFEYKWYYMGIDLKVRLQLVEQNWPYFFGFGFPLYVATHTVSSTVSGYTYSSLFPFMVISATRASAPSLNHGVKLPIFKPAAWVCSYLFSSSIRLRKSRTK